MKYRRQTSDFQGGVMKREIRCEYCGSPGTLSGGVAVFECGRFYGFIDIENYNDTATK